MSIAVYLFIIRKEKKGLKLEESQFCMTIFIQKNNKSNQIYAKQNAYGKNKQDQ